EPSSPPSQDTASAADGTAATTPKPIAATRERTDSEVPAALALFSKADQKRLTRAGVSDDLIIRAADLAPAYYKPLVAVLPQGAATFQDWLVRYEDERDWSYDEHEEILALIDPPIPDADLAADGEECTRIGAFIMHVHGYDHGDGREGITDLQEL